MTNRHDQILTIDLRPRRRRNFDSPLDGWTANASPLEHRLMVEQSGDPDAWLDHLTRCDNCFRETRRVRIQDFADRLEIERRATV